MRSNLPDMRTRTDDLVTVEAPTAEQALRLITRKLGSDAEIVDARREPRGGLAGFFAREMVVMTARAADPAPSADTVADPAHPTPGSVAGAFDALIAQAEEAEDDFESVLRRRLAADAHAPMTAEPVDPIAGTRAPGAGTAAPTPAVPATPTTVRGGASRYPGAVLWDRRRLLRQGFPGDLLANCAGLDPADDLGWLRTIAELVAPVCGPLPPSGLLVGRRADRLGAALGLDVAAVCVIRDEDEERRIGPALVGHPLHLVLDGADGTLGLVDDPVAVSWVGDDAAARALSVARALGVTLGYGMGSELGAEPVRATPLDVAYAIRRTMERER